MNVICECDYHYQLQKCTELVIVMKKHTEGCKQEDGAKKPDTKRVDTTYSWRNTDLSELWFFSGPNVPGNKGLSVYIQTPYYVSIYTTWLYHIILVAF